MLACKRTTPLSGYPSLKWLLLPPPPRCAAVFSAGSLRATFHVAPPAWHAGLQTDHPAIWLSIPEVASPPPPSSVRRCFQCGFPSGDVSRSPPCLACWPANGPPRYLAIHP